MKYSLTEKAGLLAAGNLVTTGLYFFLPLFLVRLLTKEEFGIYGQLSLVGNILCPILLFGFPSSIYYFYPRLKEEQKPGFLFYTALLFLLAGLLGGGLLYLFADPMSRILHNEQLVPLVKVYSFYILFFVSSDALFHYLIIFDRIPWNIWIGIIETVARFPFILIPLWLGYGLPGVFVSLTLLIGLKFLFFLLYMARRLSWRRIAWDRSLMAKQVRYASPLGASGAIATVGQYANKAIVASLFTPAQYAIFTVGSIQFPISTVLTKAVKPVLREQFAKYYAQGQYRDIVETWKESIRKHCLIVVPIFAFLFLFAPLIIELLYTREYLDSVPVFRVLLFLLLQTTVSFSLIPESLGHTEVTLRASVLLLVANLGLSLALFSPFGILGPAVAGVLATYLGGVYAISWVRRLTSVPYHELFPWSAMLKISIGAAVGALAAYGVLWSAWPPAGNIAVGGMIFSTAYLLVVFKSGLLTSDDRMLIKKWTARFTTVGRLLATGEKKS